MALYKIKYTPESLQEIKEIVHYYEDVSTGLGKTFNANFLIAIKKGKSKSFLCFCKI